MSKRTGVQFNCFSPPIMLATLAIEMTLAIYTVWRYKMTTLTRLAVTTLIGLAIFQLSEYFVCAGYGMRAERWSIVGFVAITTLPALGLHMLHEIADKPRRRLIAAAYVSMAGFIGIFIAYYAAFVGHQCTGNYVIFQIGERLGGAYYIYYFGWLFTAIALGIQWANQLQEKGKSALRQLESVRGLIVGYLVFLVPVAVVNTINPESRRGIPSIMCGFAVLFALILTLYVLPRAAEQRQEDHESKKGMTQKA
ncbi:MAG: hypothetical protein AAB436_02570 [Patescibacteria group bacterium]